MPRIPYRYKCVHNKYTEGTLYAIVLNCIVKEIMWVFIILHLDGRVKERFIAFAAETVFCCRNSGDWSELNWGVMGSEPFEYGRFLKTGRLMDTTSKLFHDPEHHAVAQTLSNCTFVWATYYYFVEELYKCVCREVFGSPSRLEQHVVVPKKHWIFFRAPPFAVAEFFFSHQINVFRLDWNRLLSRSCPVCNFMGPLHTHNNDQSCSFVDFVKKFNHTKNHLDWKPFDSWSAPETIWYLISTYLDWKNTHKRVRIRCKQ